MQRLMASRERGANESCFWMEFYVQQQRTASVHDGSRPSSSYRLKSNESMVSALRGLADWRDGHLTPQLRDLCKFEVQGRVGGVELEGVDHEITITR